MHSGPYLQKVWHKAAPGLSPIVHGKEIWNLLIYVAQLFEKIHTGYIIIKVWNTFHDQTSFLLCHISIQNLWMWC